MYKLVIADDESVILKGLGKLIDWGKLNIEITGEANDGQALQKIIVEQKPDLVLCDIMMPFMTGLEVLGWYNDVYSGKKCTKFVFISGYQEFSYAKEALSKGAVDYLLKPVGKKELESAMRKAIAQIQNAETVQIFEPQKDDFQVMFENLNDGRNYENEELYKILKEKNIDLSGKKLVGATIGIQPDIVAALAESAFAHFNLVRFSVYNKLTEALGSISLGYLIKRSPKAACFILILPEDMQRNSLEDILKKIISEIEESVDVLLTAGIGEIILDPEGMIKTYLQSEKAFDLFFFEPKKIIFSGEKRKCETVTVNDYTEHQENAIRCIVSKDPMAVDRIMDVVDLIYEIHYGNSKAVKMRCMNLTGEICSRLERYQMLTRDFFKMQDALQEEVEHSTTFSELKDILKDHFEDLISEMYEADKSIGNLMIEEVKKYIQVNYQKDLSIRELADVACVSQNYFSAMFKKETGQNYKAYLTDIRMEKALKLLRTTDLRTYEIGEKVGYNNVRRFVDAFKKRYDLSPVEYKKNKMKPSGN